MLHVCGICDLTVLIHKNQQSNRKFLTHATSPLQARGTHWLDVVHTAEGPKLRNYDFSKITATSTRTKTA